MIEESLMVFPARSAVEADSTIMPSSRSWIRTSIDDMAECTSGDDFSVVIWLNLPSMGIIPSAKYEFFLTYLANMLTDYPKNGLALIVFPNRAAQLDKRTWGSVVI